LSPAVRPPRRFVPSFSHCSTSFIHPETWPSWPTRPPSPPAQKITKILDPKKERVSKPKRRVVSWPSGVTEMGR
jgi:hypothetical protein